MLLDTPNALFELANEDAVTEHGRMIGGDGLAQARDIGPDFLEAAVHGLELPVHGLELPVNAFQSPVQALKPAVMAAHCLGHLQEQLVDSSDVAAVALTYEPI